MRISAWSSDVCSSDLHSILQIGVAAALPTAALFLLPGQCAQCYRLSFFTTFARGGFDSLGRAEELASDRGVIFLSGNGGQGSIHGSVRWPDPVCIRLIRQFGINDDLVPQSAAKRRIFGIGQAGVQRNQVLVRIAVASACRQRQRQGEGGGQGE